jgi:internalin A
MVPLPGRPDEVVPYNDLLAMEAKGLAEFPKVVGAEIRTYKISDLLNGVNLPGYKNEMRSEAGGVSLFFSYAHQDERYKNSLVTHLQLLRRQGTISTWSDRKTGAGENWREQILKELEGADIILLLISPDFLATDFCYNVELKRALERHRAGEAVAIPIIVRDSMLENSAFSDLQVLPEGGRAVDLWDKRDSAWRNVAEGIERAAERFRKLSA